MNQTKRTAVIYILKIFVLFICFSLSRSYAAVWAKTTMEKLVKSSEFVVDASVIEQESRWDEAHKIIHTFVKIKVTQVLKGENVPEYITLRQLGGRVGEEAMVVHGAPDFYNGQESTLFIVHHNGHYKTHSLGMGKFDKKQENGIVYSVNTKIAAELIEASNIKSESLIYPKFRNDALKSEIQLYK